MCKKIVIRGHIENLTVDRRLSYFVEELDEGEKLCYADILVLAPCDIMSLACDIIRAREENPFCRVVLSPEAFQENLLSSLFPFAEFLEKREEIRLSEIYSSSLTYRSSYDVRPLNGREKRILKPISYGLSDKETALFLGVSRRTVVRMKQSVIEKAGLLSSGQLAVFCAVRTWMSSPRPLAENAKDRMEYAHDGKGNRNIESAGFRDPP